jgi:8-oxo-dGTP pyrophosphatase MutT (NUDIX family)
MAAFLPLLLRLPRRVANNPLSSALRIPTTISVTPCRFYTTPEPKKIVTSFLLRAGGYPSPSPAPASAPGPTKTYTQVLLLRRSPTSSPYPSLWAAVSGKIELSDANPRDAALREIYEETGLTKEELWLVRGEGSEPVEIRDERERDGRVGWRAWVFGWEVGGRNGEREVEEVELNEENVEARWVGLEEVEGMETVPDLNETLRRLLDEG